MYCAHRRPKTRSFENLPSACEVGNPLTSNRRSSDPSLNEKWQDHRRSLELNIGTGTEGAASPDPDERVNGQTVVGIMGTLPSGGTENGEGPEDVRLPIMEGVDEAELTVGVAMGQMENILQEATKDESASDSRRDAKTDHAKSDDIIKSDDIAHSEESNSGIDDAQESKAKSLGNGNVNGHCSEDGNSEASSALSQDTSGSQDSEEVTLEKCMIQEHNPSCSTANFPPNGLRTLTNGHGVEKPPGREVIEQRLSLLESSTETLTEDLGVLQESLAPLIIPPPLKALAESSCLKQGLRTAANPQGAPRTLNNTPKRPSLSAFPPSTDLLHSVCNGDSPDPEPSTPRTNGERATLSRQVSLASCGSLTLHARGACSHHRCLHLGFLGRPSFSPPEPPSARNHLDDDGLTLHTDAVQQRLRQIEAGHQLEVDALKRQVQELWSRLESHQAAGMLRLNGDIGDEVVSRAHYCLIPLTWFGFVFFS